jgi:hypothetical protein
VLIPPAIRNCPRCKKPRKASKQLSISRLPPILLIHLKRFSFKGPFSDRIDSTVHFPLTDLDLTNLLPPPLPPSSASYKENQPPPSPPRYSYDLYGVSNHFGTLSSGHCEWDRCPSGSCRTLGLNVVDDRRYRVCQKPESVVQHWRQQGLACQRCRSSKGERANRAVPVGSLRLLMAVRWVRRGRQRISSSIVGQSESLGVGGSILFCLSLLFVACDTQSNQNWHFFSPFSPCTKQRSLFDLLRPSCEFDHVAPQEAG